MIVTSVAYGFDRVTLLLENYLQPLGNAYGKTDFLPKRQKVFMSNGSTYDSCSNISVIRLN